MKRPFSRRTLAKGTAWAVPSVTVAAAAPAFASSTAVACTTTDMRKMYWQKTSSHVAPSTTAVTYSGAAGATLTSVTLTQSGTKVQAAPSNFTVSTQDRYNTSPSSFGGVFTGSSFLLLNQTVQDTSSGMNVTFQFSAPVYCLSFWVTDVDSQMQCPGLLYDGIDGGYADKIWATSPTATFTASLGSGTTNISTSGNTAQVINHPTTCSTRGDYDWGTTSNKGDVCFSAAGPLTEFTFYYRNWWPDLNTGAIESGQQQIYISPFTYTANTTCLCPSCPTS